MLPVSKPRRARARGPGGALFMLGFAGNKNSDFKILKNVSFYRDCFRGYYYYYYYLVGCPFFCYNDRVNFEIK